jgi:hypothetical protein
VNFCEQKCARAGPNRDTFKPDFMSGWQVDQRRACNLLMMFIYLKYYFHSFMMSWVSLWKTALSNPFVSEVRAARTVTSKWLKCAQVWPLFNISKTSAPREVTRRCFQSRHWTFQPP